MKRKIFISSVFVMALGVLLIGLMDSSNRLQTSIFSDHERNGLLKLMDLTDQNSTTVVEFPQGYLRRFLITTPSPDFEVTVSIVVKGTTVYERNVTYENSSRCNWLEGRYARILDMNAHETLDKIEAGTACEIDLRFNRKPDGSQSLWLAYVNRLEDLKK